MISGTHIATISDKGIELPRKPLILWEDVIKFEIEEDTVGWIRGRGSGTGTRTGISHSDTRVIIKYTINEDDESLTEKIDPGVSNYTTNELMKILSEFHDRSKSK